MVQSFIFSYDDLAVLVCRPLELKSFDFSNIISNYSRFDPNVSSKE